MLCPSQIVVVPVIGLINGAMLTVAVTAVLALAQTPVTLNVMRGRLVEVVWLLSVPNPV